MRIGLVGVGRIGAFHASILLWLPGVDSLIVTDADVARAVRESLYYLRGLFGGQQ